MESKPWHRHYDYCVPTTIRTPRIPVQELLHIAANTYPDKVALYFMGVEMTFGELRRQVIKMANALSAMGVQKHDRIGLHLPNCPQYVISYFAALSIGAIVVNMSPMYTADELKVIVQTTEPKTIITMDQTLPVIQALSRACDVPTVIVSRISDYARRHQDATSRGLDLENGYSHFSTLLQAGQESIRIRTQVFPEDPALIQFTGGTTGAPKGAVLTHANMLASTFQASLWATPIVQLIPAERRTIIAALPLFHVYGNIAILNKAIFTCSSIILVPRFQVDEVMDLMSKFKEIHFFHAVPTMINAVINHPKASEMDLGRKLTVLISGAAPMPREMIEQVKDLGICFSEGYGLSESTALGISNPFFGLKKAGSIGIPMMDDDVKLVDLDEGVGEVPQGQPGEIVMRGPLIMQGYWKNEEETAAQIQNGWLYTGDIAVKDEDGYLFIVDRKKDVIIAGGYNIYPREIDDVLFQHPKVQDAISIGVPDPYRGETVKAFVVVKPGVTATEAEIRTFCKEKLAPYKVPTIVEFRTSLPRSAVGKALRKVLKAEELSRRTKD